ncbi:MAG: hypothetical protein A2898_03560 [Candidatus Kerfeldbacteria bacterium RIFCSPLOWO2_01_FULL_48_11]|uniref:Uncharacterized protein n=1 Tax=Candidatus Kerfeldbacteria bacterium RIFCSPLOWO2_01_FULL_48_11 TaxID=1798543 RepID=A0A1G2B3P5_9BACT|nr:MAG: hypothetical protein UY34_C0010G0019 [Parcubacteria group bacterium GW2011_GWA2_48_9]KKW16269.1 MAG: hypothetical protein UY52_C0007G0029 [Parcubacteria group bacterium GW2011_GWC2_49_9]OGY83336.1 MAG: hypothetical protein A2898_03560 [Candidatus Kerfeldbacteria bacterium RIFCSPLOWO2_01_FULL_48_11]HCM68740.1 hypothetical protein [Candidatus Kerfeldbacteria bacterium]
MNRTFNIGIVALVLLVFAGCNAKEKRLATELQVTQNTVTQLQTELQSARDNNDALADSNASCQTVLDSVMNTIDSISERNTALRAELKTAQAKYEQSLNELTRQRDDIRAMLTFVERERDTMLTRVSQLAQSERDLTEQLQIVYDRSVTLKDWYEYWRYDARRSWWQRTWGTNHAKRPESSEQSFEYYYPLPASQAIWR